MPPLLSLSRVRLPGRHRDLPPASDAIEETPAPIDATLILTRGEAERLSTWLDRAPTHDRRSGQTTSAGVCTPEHLRRAIAGRLAADGGGGEVDVLRLPAALTTPEAWEIRLARVPPTTVVGLEDAAGRHRRPEPDHAD